MKSIRKHATAALAIASALALTVGVFAFFTDRVQSTATATAGTLDLELDNFAASSTTKFKPGDGISLTYTLSDVGNKSADVLETIMVTYTPADGTTSTISSSKPEFALYAASDVSIDDNGVATVAEDATALSVVSEDGTQITYAVPQFTLNGTGDNAETETGVTSNAKDGAYVLVFNADASNDFSGATLTVDYEAQAKQHRNTGKDTWTTVQSETVTFAGDESWAAVPAVAAN
jgi:predicted ribosomally synthesized peptide with SipW-like signal peptide